MTKERSEWYANDGDNDFAVADGGVAEGMKRSDVNDAARARMGATTRWGEPYNMAGDNGLGHMEWLDILRDTSDRTPLTLIRTDATHIRVNVGAQGHEKYFKDELATSAGKRRIRVTDSRTSPTVVTDMFVTDYTYSNPDLDLTVDTTLPATVGAVYLHSMQALDAFAFRSTIPGFYVTPDDFTEAALDVALATLASNGGGVLLLDVGTYEITTAKSLIDPIIILGRGAHATTIKAADSAAISTYMMRTVNDGDGGGLRDLTFDGNRANNGTTSAGVIFWVASRVVDFHIDGTRFIGAGEDALYISNSGGTGDANKTTRIYVDNCTFSDCSRHGIFIQDDYTTDVAYYLSNIDISLIGQTDNNGAGIKAAGQVSINNVQVSGLNRGAGSVQRGIWLVEPTTAPNLKDARHSTLSNFHVDGTGQDVVGVQIGGHEIAVANGVLTLSGPNAFGVQISDSGIASPHAVAIDNVVVDDAWVGVQLQPGSHECSVSNTHFKNCFDGIQVQGDRHSIRGVTVDSVSRYGVNVAATASGTHIHGVHVYAGADTGVIVFDGAEDTVISGVVVRSATDAGLSIDADDTVVQDCAIFDTPTGIDVLANATDVKINEIRMHGVATEVADAGSHTIIDAVDGIVDRVIHEDTSTDAIPSGTFEWPDLFHGLAWPCLGPNGYRRFDVKLVHTTSGGVGWLRLMSGTGDDALTDDVLTPSPGYIDVADYRSDIDPSYTDQTEYLNLIPAGTGGVAETLGVAARDESGTPLITYQLLVITRVRGT